MRTTCHGRRRNTAWIIAALSIPLMVSTQQVALGAGTAVGAKAGPSAAPAAASPAPAAPAAAAPAPAAAAPASASPARPAAPVNGTSSGNSPGNTPINSPTNTPVNAPVNSPVNAPVNAPNQNPQTPKPTLPNNTQTGSDRTGQHNPRNGQTLLIPGYYGDNYWDSGWSNNQNQYWNQFSPNDSNGNNSQANTNQQEQQQAEQTPALIEPAVQAETPSASAALRASPEFQEADAQERSAQSAYDAIRRRVIDQLKQSPEYQQAEQRKQSEAAKISSIKGGNANTAPEKTEGAAEAKLAVAKTITDMESDAVSADPQATAAKSKLDAAVARRNAIRTRVLGSLPNSPANRH